MATSEPVTQNIRVGTTTRSRTEANIVDVRNLPLKMSDLEVYGSSRAIWGTHGFADTHRDVLNYNFSSDEYSRLISAYSERHGYGYTDAEVLRMAKDYIKGDTRKRAIIYERLTDSNFHSAAAQIVMLSDDTEALKAIASRKKVRRAR